MTKNIQVFASGNGSNARRIDEYFKKKYGYGISHVYSNKVNAPVLDWARDNGINTTILKKGWQNEINSLLEDNPLQRADIIVLAGFLQKIPSDFINEISAPIINIHPSLLPDYGGSGMYGDHVHKAVIQNQEKKSGITIHHVNDQYDEGQIIKQKSFPIAENESLETLKEKIHRLEHETFPEVIDSMLYKEDK